MPRFSLRYFGLAFGLTIAITTPATPAAFPNAISYQGRLMTPAGLPVADGTYSVVFTIYTAPTSGSAKWAEIQFVNTADGFFEVLLGTVMPLVDTVFGPNAYGEKRYLGVKIGSDPEMTPRRLLAAAPYAYQVASINGADGGTINGDLTIGLNHLKSGSYSSIGGGYGDTLTGDWSYIGGGWDNEVSGDQSFLGGGYNNRSTGEGAVIVGGAHNLETGYCSTIGGGYHNVAYREYSTVPGGVMNRAGGYASFAAGYFAHAIHDACFVWADTSVKDGEFESTGRHQFLVRATGGVGLGTNSPEAQLHVLTSSGGTMSAHPNSIAVFERGESGYLSVLTPSTAESGILFGNPDNTNNGGVVFNSATNPEGLQFRVNQGQNALVIDQDSEVGIQVANPTHSLEIAQNTVADPIADAWTVYSSRRWKQNIRTIDHPLEKVQRLRGVSYDLKSSGQHDIGLIAEEVGAVIPEVVQYEENGKDAQSVDYARLVALLIEGMKAQQMQIEVLQSELAAQRERLAQVEKMPQSHGKK